MPKKHVRSRAVLPLMLLALGPLIFGIGCGGTADQGDDRPGGDTPRDLDYPRGADEVVLQVESPGGFNTPEFTFATLPLFTLYGDGRLIYSGPMIEIYPPPALPNLRQRTLSPEGVARLLERAAEAGLLEEGRDLGRPTVTDVPDTVFTVNLNAASYVTTAYALGYEDPGAPSGLSDEQLDARQQLLDFQTALFDLDVWLADEIGPDEEYVYEALALRIAAPPAEADPSGIEPDVVSWPLADLATLGRAEGDHRVAVVRGPELEQLRPMLASANTLTLWESGGQTYHLAIRPLLPHETDAP